MIWFSYLRMSKEYPRNHIELEKEWIIFSMVIVTHHFTDELWLFYSSLKYNLLTLLTRSNMFRAFNLCISLWLILRIMFSYTSVLKIGHFLHTYLKWLQMKFCKPKYIFRVNYMELHIYDHFEIKNKISNVLTDIYGYKPKGLLLVLR